MHQLLHWHFTLSMITVTSLSISPVSCVQELYHNDCGYMIITVLSISTVSCARVLYHCGYICLLALSPVYGFYWDYVIITSRSISTVSCIPVLYHCGYMIITVTVLVPAVKFLHVVAVSSSVCELFIIKDVCVFIPNAWFGEPIEVNKLASNSWCNS